MTCSTCLHWKRCAPENAERGQCRRHPPRIAEAVLHRSLEIARLNDEEMSATLDDIADASLWPITAAWASCGEHVDEMPL